MLAVAVELNEGVKVWELVEFCEGVTAAEAASVGVLVDVIEGDNISDAVELGVKDTLELVVDVRETENVDVDV